MIAAIAGAGLFSGGGLAASTASISEAADPIDPARAEEGRTVSNVAVNFTVNDIGGDGNTDFVFLTFPNELANKSGFGFNAFTKNSSPGVSGSLVDGPDSDGIQDTVSLSGWDSGTTYDANVSVDMSLDLPAVTADTVYEINASVNDSQSGSRTTETVVAEFTVTAAFELANASVSVDEAADQVTLSYDVQGSSRVGTFYKIFPANPPEYSAEPGFFSGPTEDNPRTVTRTVPLSGGAVDADGNGLQEGERYVYEAYVNNRDGSGFQTTLARFTTPSGPLAATLSGSAVNSTAVDLTANVTGFNGTDTVNSYYSYREKGSTGGSTFVGGPEWDLPDRDKATTITGLDPGTTYVFTITVNNGDGDTVKETVEVTTGS